MSLQKPNVLAIVSYKVYPAMMGGQKGVVLFYKYLQKHVNLTIAATRDNEQSGTAEINSFLYPNKYIFLNLFLIGKLKRIIHKKKINAVLIEHSYPAWLGYLLRIGTKVPFVIHAHNIEAERFKMMNKWWWRLYAHYERWAFRQADHNFFISENDKEKAIRSFGLDNKKCTTITYGIEANYKSTNEDATNKQATFRNDETLFFFNGTLDYKPNYDAVHYLMDKIEPLISNYLHNYTFMVTGNRITESLEKKLEENNKFRYLGFVENIDIVYQSCALFLNPVLNDSGVKTKVIEALANGCTVISTKSGATGINKEVCINKLIVVADGDWQDFANQIILQLKKEPTPTPGEFYNYYGWENIAQKAAAAIKDIIN